VRRVTLLGRLDDAVILGAEFDALGVDGPVALVTAGWEEGERNDAGIDRRLGGGSRNLGLYGRRLDVLGSDDEYANAERLVRTQLTELRETYAVRVRHALEGLAALRRRMGEEQTGSELDIAIASVRAIDDAHVAAITDVYERFYAAHPPHERPVIAEHRAELAAIVSGCAAIAIAGGHVGTLNDCLHLCNIASLVDDKPLIAWSSGCMAISERIMVIDDDDPAGRADEIYDVGVGIARGLVALPVSARLRAHDSGELAVLAGRCVPNVCVVLDAGDRLQLQSGQPSGLEAVRVITPDGRVVQGAEAA
jgi:hypothetical protein